MQIENILEILYGKRKDYKGTQIMRELITKNETFRELIIEGIKTGNIYSWSEELWEKLDKQNFMENYEKISDAFSCGHNLGRCLTYSKYVSYSFPLGCKIASGIVEFLKGTINSPEGKHTWIENDGKIYDTTFMIVINLPYVKKLKYKHQFISDPNKDKYYSVEKEFANDTNLNLSGKHR